MKQTAVEMIFESFFDMKWEDMQDSQKPVIFLQAKEMEKEQIKDAYKQGTCHHGDGYTATEYYEETFKANEKCTASSPGSGQPPKS
jgi:hypothetical protein